MQKACFVYKAQLQALSMCRADISAWYNAGCYHFRISDILIATSEVVQNILRYGFGGGNGKGHIVLKIKADAEWLEISLIDDAPPSFPQQWSTDGKPPHQGGFGLKLIAAVTEKAKFQPTENGNIATLRFRAVQDSEISC